MKTRIRFAAATAILSGLLFSQVSTAHEVETRYIFKGDDSARAICLAIAKNQPNRLKHALRNERINLTDTRVHTRFTCNGKDLFSFSQEMGADKVAVVLAPKFGQEVGVAVADTMIN